MGVEGTRPSTGELFVCREGHPSRGGGAGDPPGKEGGGSCHAVPRPQEAGARAASAGQGLTPSAQEPARTQGLVPRLVSRKWGGGLLPRTQEVGARSTRAGGLMSAGRGARSMLRALGSGARAARARVRADPVRAESENSHHASRGGPAPAISGGSLHVPRKQGLAPRVPEFPACKGRGTRTAAGGYLGAQEGRARAAPRGQERGGGRPARAGGRADPAHTGTRVLALWAPTRARRGGSHHASRKGGTCRMCQGCQACKK